MSKSDIKLKAALDAAYNICLQVSDLTDNVISSCNDSEVLEVDVKNNEDAKTYIKWYKQTFNP